MNKWMRILKNLFFIAEIPSSKKVTRKRKLKRGPNERRNLSRETLQSNREQSSSSDEDGSAANKMRKGLI